MASYFHISTLLQLSSHSDRMQWQLYAQASVTVVRTFWARSQNLEKNTATISFVVYVRPSIHPSTWKNSARNGRNFIKFGWLFSNICHENWKFNKIWQEKQIPYILESNPHPFYSFRGLKNQMRIRNACGLDSQSRAGFWKNDRAAVRAVRTIQ